MDLLSPQLTNIAGWTLIHSLWQLTLVVLAYAGIRSLIQKRFTHSGSQLLYLAGCGALFAMVVAPMATFVMLSSEYSTALNSSTQASPALEIREVEKSDRVPSDLQTSDILTIGQVITGNELQESNTPIVSPVSKSTFTAPFLWLVLTWLIGVCLFSLRPILGMLRVRNLAQSGNKPASPQLQKSVQRIAEQLKLRTAFRLAESALVQVPTVVGYFKPMVLIPTTAITGLNEQQLKLILTHELAHIRRHDFLINLFQTFVESLLFYHPAIWWMSNEVRVQRENCCDDVAVAISGDATSMAKALLALEESRVIAPALAANGGSLVTRVKRLLGEHRVQRTMLHWPSFALTIVAIALIAALPATQAKPPETAVADQDPVGTKLTDVEQPPSGEHAPSITPSDVVATVNGLEILRDQVTPGLSPKSGLPTLEQKVREIVLQQECKRRGITVSPDEIESDIQAKALKLGLTKQNYVDLILERRQITREKLEELSEVEIKLRKLVADFVSSDISKAELDEEVEFLFGPRAKVLAFNSSNQKVAIRFWNALKDNSNAEAFSKLTKQYREEEGTIVSIGTFPSIPRQRNSSHLEKVAFELNEGEISPVIQMGDQWQVLIGDGRTEWIKEVESGSQARSARESIRRRRFQEASHERLKRLVHQAKIERVSPDSEFDHAFLQLPVDGVDEEAAYVATYAVADLVVSHHPWLNMPRGKVENPGKVDFEPLIKLIKDTIDPDSWIQRGIQGYEPHLSIVVHQTRTNHASIADLLAKLRELNDISIETSSFLLIIPREEMVNNPFRFEKEYKPISRREALMLRASAIAKDSVQEQTIPMVSIFNGQRYEIAFDITGAPQGEQLTLQQTISQNRAEVRTCLHLERTKQGTVLSSKSDQFVAVDITKILALDPEKQKAIFVFKSHISEDVE